MYLMGTKQSTRIGIMWHRRAQAVTNIHLRASVRFNLYFECNLIAMAGPLQVIVMSCCQLLTLRQQLSG